MKKPSKDLKFRTNFEKNVILDNFEKRKWSKTYDDDWNFFWASVGNVRKMFNPHSGVRLLDHQIINHFPNHYELVRKDLMVKNIKRYAKDMQKQGTPTRILEFLPESFVLPVEYCLFEKAYAEQSSMWIFKPIGRYGGAGISLITKKSQIKDWLRDKGRYCSTRDYNIISRYLSNPLLIGGRKFDLRLYILVVSYKPLKAYFYNEGFARFSAYKYTNNVTDQASMKIHCTNTTLQKGGAAYNDKHGLKWAVSNLRCLLEATKGKETTDKLFEEMDYICIESLKSCQAVMYNDKHCFELYGFDIMIDSNLKPWLIEINSSPSLATTTPADRILKSRLMHDTIDILIKPEYPDVPYYEYKLENDTNLGNYRLLVDESSEIDRENYKRGFINRNVSSRRSTRP